MHFVESMDASDHFPESRLSQILERPRINRLVLNALGRRPKDREIRDECTSTLFGAADRSRHVGTEELKEQLCAKRRGKTEATSLTSILPCSIARSVYSKPSRSNALSRHSCRPHNRMIDARRCFT